jgi:hypothetical protein
MVSKRLQAAVVVAGVLQSLAAPSFAQSSGSASVLSRFAGTWREDVSKRQLGGSTPNLRFQRNGQGGLEEVRGAEASPLIQPVNFTGKPYPVDGGRYLITWRQLDPNNFERVLADPKGATVTVRKIRVSADSKTLTEVTERKLANGRSAMDTLVLRRSGSGGSGLVGRWIPESFKTDTPTQVKYEVTGSGLKFTDDLGTTYTVSLGGKPVAMIGRNVISGSMIAAQQTNDHTIEFIENRDGVPTARSVRTLSADGKTLTVTTTNIGPDASGAPSIVVYVKQ